jgi:hypothetical protein
MSKGKGKPASQPVTKEQRAAAKRDRFLRLVERRVSRAIKAIKACQNLANKANYTYTEKEAAQIIDAVVATTAELGQAFDKSPEVRSMFEFTPDTLDNPAERKK